MSKRPTITAAGRIWRCRWATLRLLFAGWLLWTCVSDNTARMARLQLASLAPYDYAAEVRGLRQADRFGEALMVADAGLEELSGTERDALQQERYLTIQSRDNAWRRIREVGIGAIRGDGDSIEALVGAIGADMLIVGDVRDLVFQASRLAVDGEADPIITALSAIGIATTLAPEVDWGASILKIAKKLSVMSREMVEALLPICRQAFKLGKYDELKSISKNIRVVAEHSSPAGAIRLLRHLDHPKDIERMAEFLVRQRKSGAFAIHLAGDEGVKLIKGGGKVGEEALVMMTKRGDKGIAFLRSGNVRLLRPHPVLGLVKAGYKGTGVKLLRRVVAEYLDPYGMICIFLLSAWVCLEMWILWRRLTRESASPRAAVQNRC